MQMKKAGICLSGRIHRAHIRMNVAGPLIFLSLGLAAPLAPVSHAQTDTSWKVTSSMKNARRLHTATLLPDGKVLVAGGLSDSTGENIPTTTVEIYDPATRTWRPTGSLNFARSSHTATLLAN